MPSTFDSANSSDGPALHLFGCKASILSSNSSSGGELPPSVAADAGSVNTVNVSPARQTEPVTEVPATKIPSSEPAPSDDKASSLLERSAPFHRIAEVRKQQGVSERTVARRLGIEIKRYRELEDPGRDLTLSELYALQAALEVPVADLLVDSYALSRPVEERAKMIKIMKTAVAMREAKISPRAERMAHMLCEQLVDLMPELAEVSGWPQFGARRGMSAIGKALQNPIDMSGIHISE